ncbi:EamA family transporter [Deinococcus humi]|uniref:Inner membrane transporter RhtA n=1 Tax=Deinococcus humi TaxID=662880 RepID=A0A7W8NC88_9DEIO|nr:DMT family transporter [Deinococcus humi]MBB5361919.1 inner membrane transporter RhtA [Deinococcus humi]GGO22988.1 threonine transporter RhtB [Deinococcus humi]
MRRFSLPPIPALLLSMLSIQAGAAYAKTLFPLIGPLGTTGLRVGLAAAILMLIFRPNLRLLTRADWQAVVPYGAVLGLMNLTYYLSLERLPLAIAVTLEFLGPLLLAAALSRRALDFLWVALAGAGIFLISPHGTGTAGALDPIGVTLALVAGGFWAAYILLGGAVGRRLPGTAGVAVGMLVAAAVCVPMGVAQAGTALLAPGVLLTGLTVAALSSALPYSLEMRALRLVPPRVFGVMMSVEPAMGAVCGLLFLGEALAGLQWLAIACVILASAGINLTTPRPPPVAEPVN